MSVESSTDEHTRLAKFSATQGNVGKAAQKLKKNKHFNWNYYDEISPKNKSKKFKIDDFANVMRSVRGKLKSKKVKIDKVYKHDQTLNN